MNLWDKILIALGLKKKPKKPIVVPPKPVEPVPLPIPDPIPIPQPAPLRDPVLNWPDRRPIGCIFLASYEDRLFGRKQNPRQWKVEETTDITTITGLASFNRSVMNIADRSIERLKQLNAQGVIIWDIEGQEFPHPITYVGSPNILAEEMEPLVDAFFKKFTDAGFKVGVCIRPHDIVYVNGWINQVQAKDPLKSLTDRITYAKNRWGCTLFYIDSNVWPDPYNGPSVMDVSIFAALNKKFHDCLLIPEHKTFDYFKHTAPYQELRKDSHVLGKAHKDLLPDAFMVLNASDAPVSVELLKETIKEGNIILTRTWFDDPVHELIKKAYETNR